MTASSEPAPELHTDALISIYTHAGESALVGAFAAGSKSARSSILTKLRFLPLPEELLTEALESDEDEILWTLSSRKDLSSEAIERLIRQRSPIMHRTLATNPQLTNAQLDRLLPGDEFLRQRVFTHPNASRTLRRQIVSARNSSGELLPRADSLNQELDQPMYALWLLDSDTQEGRLRSLSFLPSLPAAHQWRIALRVADGAIPLPQALGAPGWVAPLGNALREAVVTLARNGEETALEEFSSTLRTLGEPPLSAEAESRLLADGSEARALADPRKLNWTSLERILRSGEMSIHAVRYLLKREDRTAGFTSAALVFHGDAIGVLGLCTLKDLQVAAAMTGFAPMERARLLKLVVTNPHLPYGLLDMIAPFPIRDVLAELQVAEESLGEFQMRRLGEELSAKVGSSPQAWRDFEAARKERPNITFGGALQAAGVMEPKAA